MYITRKTCTLHAGHGYDLVNLQCAEFCVTSHRFVVNGAEHLVQYKEAGQINCSFLAAAAVWNDLGNGASRGGSVSRHTSQHHALLYGMSFYDHAQTDAPCPDCECPLGAGTQWGCADKVRQGVTPNEHGTWQFGRMGWCDGQEVCRQSCQTCPAFSWCYIRSAFILCCCSLLVAA